MKESPESVYDTGRIKAARGIACADIQFSNAEVFNPFTGEWQHIAFAVKDGFVIGPGSARAHRHIDLKGRRVVAGLIDAHVHIESSLLSPPESARLVSEHGTTTVIADPHEIANVCGTEGIQARWFDYSRARDAMFAVTDTPECPWYVVPSNDQRRARLHCITHFLSLIPYEEVPREPIKFPKPQEKGDYKEPDYPYRIVPQKY